MRRCHHSPPASALAHGRAGWLTRGCRRVAGTNRELRFCDYFGEVPLLTDEVHASSATATSKVEMIEIKKRDMRYLMSRRPNLKERVMRRAKLRYAASYGAIGANSVFSTFSMSQVGCPVKKISAHAPPPSE